MRVLMWDWLFPEVFAVGFRQWLGGLVCFSVGYGFGFGCL